MCEMCSNNSCVWFAIQQFMCMVRHSQAASVVRTVTATTTRKSKQSLLPPLFAYNQVLKGTSFPGGQAVYLTTNRFEV
ncbi:hypothetical protein Hanom_Chr00s000004g01607001 [Helianthus anomalus]